MVPNITGTTQRYLADLDRTTTAIQRAQAQVSSGLRLQTPSDDPAAAARILALQTEIGGNTQVQANLNTVKTEVDTADGALQSAIQAVENAISLAAQSRQFHLNLRRTSQYRRPSERPTTDVGVNQSD